MRRFWAYIITVVTALLIVGVTFTSVMLKSSSNLEYSYGHEMTFRIEDRDGEEFDDDTAVNSIAGVMDERLSTAGITAYEIRKVGLDTIKVSLSETRTDHYEMIAKYLTFNATLALTTDKEEVALMNEFLTDEKAYVTTINTNIPQVVIPVDNTNAQFRAVIEAAKAEAEENSSSSSEDEETPSTYVYLWYDFIEDVDSIEASKEDTTMAEKILIQFDINQYNIDEESGEWDDKLVATIRVGDSSEENTAVSISDIQEAFYRARFYVNLVNASELDYKVTFMYSMNTDSLVEDIIVLGSLTEGLAFNSTLLCFLVTFVAVSLLLVYFYLLGALSVITTSVVSVFGALAFMVLFGVQFNTAAFIGLAIVTLVSLASGVLYLSKLKEEAYHGRSLKKANSEASKRSTLPIVDVNVVTVIIGVMVFLLGGKMMTGLAAALVFGGLLSLVLNTLALKGLMFLATNTTAFIGKYKLFGIDNEKVPNIANEEKQTYYGAYAEKDYTKQKKHVSIIGAALLVASLTGMIVFGAINNGNFFNTRTNYAENSEIYFEAVDSKQAFSKQSVQDYLDNMLLMDSEGNVTETALSNYLDEILQPDTMTERIYESGHMNEYIHYYYVALLNTNLSLDTEVSYTIINETTEEIIFTTEGQINDVLSDILTYEGNATKCTAILKAVTNVTNDKPGFGPITLATFVGLAIASVYLMLRYRLSRGLTSLLLTSSVGAITMGIFTLIRFSVSTYILAMLPGITIISLITSIFLMNREREMLNEEKAKDLTDVRREEIMRQAGGLSLNYGVPFFIIAIIITLYFFGFGPVSVSASYSMLALGILLSYIATYVLFAPLTKIFIKLFSKIKFERKPRKSSKKKIVTKKSAEPEEAVFIGIND